MYENHVDAERGGRSGGRSAFDTPSRPERVSSVQPGRRAVPSQGFGPGHTLGTEPPLPGLGEVTIATFTRCQAQSSHDLRSSARVGEEPKSSLHKHGIS